MSQQNEDAIRAAVRRHYAALVTSGADENPSTVGPRSASGCCTPGCCDSRSASLRVGYSRAEINSAPDGADLGLGCGNPQAIASLRPGETVLDLGAGAGFDAFLAARQVGPTGRVIGVDMTMEMVDRARSNAARAGIGNAEFRLGEIERLPVADQSVDVIISNCVINLSPDKQAVFNEAFRVLRPGGRLAISDVVAVTPMPEAIKASATAHASCVAGAADTKEVTTMLAKAGFSAVGIAVNAASREFIRDWMSGSGVENHVASAVIQAIKKA